MMENIMQSLEYLVSDFSIFEKLSMIRRASDIYNKIVKMDSLVFPKNPMLHILDNFDHSQEPSDVFEINKYPFLNNKQNIKYLHNFMDFESVNKEILDKFGHRIYRSKLFETIRNFNISHRKLLIPLLKLDTVVANKNCILIENYNPLYRILSTNARPINQYYRYQAIMSTVLDNTLKYDRQHFIIIPVDDNFMLSRSNIMGITQADEMSSQRLVSSSHFYFFMIDLALILLNNESKISIFNSIKPKDLSKLNFVLTHKDECIIFNIGKLATLITSNVYVYGFINTVSMLSGTSSDKIEPLTEQEKEEVVEDVPEIKETFSDVVNIPLGELSSYYSNKLSESNIFKTLMRNKRKVEAYGIKANSKICSSALFVNDFPGNILSNDYFHEKENISLITNVFTDVEYRRKGFMRKILSHILEENKGKTIFLKVDKKDKMVQSIYTSLGFNILTIKSNDADSLIMAYGFKEKEKKPEPVPIDVKKSFLIPEVAKQAIQEKDDDKIKIITDKLILTEKQKVRIETLADKYKAIEIHTAEGKKTIDDVLSTSVNIGIKSESLPIQNKEGISEDMLSSSTKVFDTHYREKLLQRDILNNVVSFRDNGLFLTNYTERNEYNEFTRVKHVKAVFTDIRNKQHTINFKLPMPDEEGYYLVNGVRLSMSKQLVNIPICKISPTRVSLISNFNKTLVDKVGSVRNSLDTVLAKKAESLGISLVPKLNTYVGLSLPYEYKLLGRAYSKIVTKDYTFFFEYHDRYKFFDYRDVDKNDFSSVESTLSELENRYGVLVGKFNENRKILIFMDGAYRCTAIDILTLNLQKIPNYISDCFGTFEVPPEWCDLKILDKNIPIAFILSYRYGLSSVLKNLKIDYRFVEKGTREKVRMKNTDIVIEFNDGYLVIDRYPLLHSYIISGLCNFPTLSNYKLIDLDGKDAYYGLIAEKGMSINYLKGIDAYFSFFIDPITKEVLQEMGEPTNTRDLLIRAVEMLIYDNDKAPSSISNFRVRSSEKIPAMIYNEISRQYANYINSEFRDVSFSINTEAIFQRLIQDETMNLREDLNPIHAVKETSRVTHAGFGGRSSQAFVSRDRKYAKDAVGILSETTTDSGSVGMVASFSGDPKIKNLRGMFDTSQEDLNTSNILSDVALLMPGATHDDQNCI